MKTEQEEIGSRLKLIRAEYYANFKLTIPEFAEELGETKHNIANYERGLASIPNRVLVALYRKGFNPTYILTGEGSVFAENLKGKERTVRAQASGKTDVSFNNQELQSKIQELISAAAGDIMGIINNQKKQAE